MTRTTSWQSLAGTFLHRAVLHPGGKWRSVKKETERDEYLDHSMRLARQLHHALRDENYYLAEALVDRGGPSWALSVDKYRELSYSDMMRAIDPLLVATEPIVSSILEHAENEKWKRVCTEVEDPLAPLMGRPSSRLDLLVDRGTDCRPLVVELKTIESEPPSGERQEDTMRITREYARVVSEASRRSVEYQCVWGDRNGRHCTWSDTQVVRRRKC